MERNRRDSVQPLLYYAIVEFSHDNKWPIVLGWIVGSVLAGYGFGRFGGVVDPRP